MERDEVTARIIGFVRERFLDGDPSGELDEHTPLLEWGVMNSLNIVQLMRFLREEMGVVVPPTEINPRNFGTIGAIGALVAELAGV